MMDGAWERLVACVVDGLVDRRVAGRVVGCLLGLMWWFVGERVELTVGLAGLWLDWAWRVGRLVDLSREWWGDGKVGGLAEWIDVGCLVELMEWLTVGGLTEACLLGGLMDGALERLVACGVAVRVGMRVDGHGVGCSLGPME